MDKVSAFNAGAKSGRWIQVNERKERIRRRRRKKGENKKRARKERRSTCIQGEEGRETLTECWPVRRSMRLHARSSSSPSQNNTTKQQLFESLSCVRCPSVSGTILFLPSHDISGKNLTASDENVLRSKLDERIQ